MRTLYSLFVGVLWLSIGVAAAIAAKQVTYDALITQLKAGDTSIDFQALRFARSELADHDPYGAVTGLIKRDMFAAFDVDDLEKASAVAAKVVEQDYTDSDSHMVLSFAHEKRGENDRAMFERAVATGLYRSIIGSGDGMSAETPYVVIAIAEEYLVLRQRGLKPVRQALIQTTKGPVDALYGVDENGMEQTLYFDVNRLFGALDRRLGGASKAP